MTSSPINIRRILVIVCMGVLTPWLVLKWVRQETIPLLKAAEAQARLPRFQLALQPLPASEVDQSTVAIALQDAKAEGEDCSFWFATVCPDTHQILYVLNVLAVSDTHLVYAGSSDGAGLASKAYWSGFGRWIDGP